MASQQQPQYAPSPVGMYPPPQPYVVVVQQAPPPPADEPKRNIFPFIMLILLSIFDLLFLPFGVIWYMAVGEINSGLYVMTLVFLLAPIMDIVMLASKRAGAKKSVIFKAIPAYLVLIAHLVTAIYYRAVDLSKLKLEEGFVAGILLNFASSLHISMLVSRMPFYLGWGLQRHVSFFSYLAPYRFPNLKQ